LLIFETAPFFCKLYLHRVQFTCRSDARLSILLQAATMSTEQWQSFNYKGKIEVLGEDLVSVTLSPPSRHCDRTWASAFRSQRL